MDVAVYDKTGKSSGSVTLPDQFNEPVREDLIRRAALTVKANTRQAYGADPRAGKRHSAKLSKRRRQYRGSYGFGISRVSRKILSRSGTRFNWTAAFVANAVGGRTPHAPTAEKVLEKKMNVKERKKALRSALAATMDKETVAKRGHIVPEGYPFVLSSDFDTVAKTKDFIQSLSSLKLDDELSRSAVKTIRAGKGTARGRKYKTRVGPLVVVSGKSALSKAARNVPGVDVVDVASLNANILAPGTHAGRLTLFTRGALTEMKEKKLFI